MITGRTQVYGVLGDPIAHSLSPVLQNGWIAQAGLDAVYVALRCPAPSAAAAMRALPALGIRGVNVTAPLKEIAAAVADTREPLVETLGAANVLTVTEGGGLHAANTDVAGFVAALDEDQPGWRSRVGAAVIIGAGGAARAIGLGLARAGVAQIIYANRTAARAQEAARITPGGAGIDLHDVGEAFQDADLVVNAISAAEGGALPFSALPLHALCVDAAYMPRPTHFLAAAQSLGFATQDGLGMLIHQGALAFALWFGQRPDVDVGQRRLLEALGE